MAREVPSEGGSASARPDGDPSAVSQEAEWVRSLALAVSEAQCLIGEARGLAEGGWRTTLSWNVYTWLDDLTTRCETLTEVANDTAEQLDAYSNNLALAQGTMDQVRAYVELNDVQMEGGYVKSPSDVAKRGPDNGPFYTGEPLDGIHQEQHYDYIHPQVEQAKSYITESKTALDEVVSSCSSLSQSAISQVISSEALGLEFRDRFLREADPLLNRASNARRWAPLLQTWNGPDLADVMDEIAERYGKQANAKLAAAANMGLIAKVAGKVGAPVTIVIGVAVDLTTGEPVDKALLKAGAGVAGGATGNALGGGLIAFAFGLAGVTPIGWVVTAGGIIGAIAVGAGASVGAGWLYDYVVDEPILIDDRWSLVEG